MSNQVLRMCVQTRTILPREEMLRFVISTDEVVCDNEYKVQGRSIYIQNDEKIISSFLKRKKLPLRLEIEKQDQVRKILGELINEQ